MTDEQARAWVKKVESFNKDFTFFIKHFDPKHLPPSYRAPSLWFLSDSQQFDGSADWLKDMKDWARAGGIAVTGYLFWVDFTANRVQFGTPAAAERAKHP